MISSRYLWYHTIRDHARCQRRSLMCNKETAVVSGNHSPQLPPPLPPSSSTTTATPPLPPPRPRPASSAAANATAAIVMVSFFSSLCQQHRNTDSVHDPPLIANRIAHVDEIVRSVGPTSVDGLAVITSLKASNALLLTVEAYVDDDGAGRRPL